MCTHPVFPHRIPPQTLARIAGAGHITRMAKVRTAKPAARKAPGNKQAERAGAAGGFAEGPQAAFEGEVYTSESTKHLIPALRNLKPSGAMPQPSHKLGKLPPIGAHPLLTGKDMPVFVPHRPPRPEKSEGGRPLIIESDFEPRGDQPTAIRELAAAARAQERDQVLLGVTGSGKTFTMAKVIEETQRPALILAPNKTLAAQLYGEFKSFFPDNAVEYFVSYYDYYQPEAYIPRTDTYIEKDSSINEQIDRMRHAATRALLERDDVIIVASVSCIYGIGSVETYSAMTFSIQVGDRVSQRQLLADLVALQYRRNNIAFARGDFRVRGDTIELFPAHQEDRAWRISMFGDEVESIAEFDPLTGEKTQDLALVKIYANSHYVTPKPTLNQAIMGIQQELQEQLQRFNETGRLLDRLSCGRRHGLCDGRVAGFRGYGRVVRGSVPQPGLGWPLVLPRLGGPRRRRARRRPRPRPRRPRHQPRQPVRAVPRFAGCASGCDPLRHRACDAAGAPMRFVSPPCGDGVGGG